MRLLDLYCGAGGAAHGYYLAGFTKIVGIDISPQKNYPYDFVRGDAKHPPFTLTDFDMIHASPPCKMYSSTRTLPNQKERVASGMYSDDIPPMQRLLRESGVPYVIENVEGAPLRRDLTLCGTMFGLRTLRHRWFEIGGYTDARPPLVLQPSCNHWGSVKNDDFFSVVGTGSRNKPEHRAISKYCRKADAQIALGIDWMYRYEMTQAVPPSYTQYIGKMMMKYIR